MNHNITNQNRTLNLGTYPEKWCQSRRKTIEGATLFESLVNLVSTVGAKLSFQSNLRLRWLKTRLTLKCIIHCVNQDNAREQH